MVITINAREHIQKRIRCRTLSKLVGGADARSSINCHKPRFTVMHFHDPRREIEIVRDHLASHDKPISFLIGAGASFATRDVDDQPLVPNLHTLGESSREKVAKLGKDSKDAYSAIEKELTESLGREPNVEDTLSSVRSKLAALGGNDTLVGLDHNGMAVLEKTIRTTIATAVRPAEIKVAYPLPQQALARWIKSIDRRHAVEIFTTNYDTLLERALEIEQVPLFDGFVGSREPFFEPATLAHRDGAPGLRWTRLWKIHGSINWHRSDRLGGRIVRTEEGGSGEMIYPSLDKYEESRKQPFVAMLQRLSDVLHHRDETVLFTLGYGWGDQHINAVIFEALAANPRTHVLALMFDEVSDESEPVKGRRHNLSVFGPRTAVIGGIRGAWRLLDPVDERTADLLDVPFDSEAQVEEEPPLGGRMRLGDFSWFARFLMEIAAYDE
jgi:hypothetical protein